MTSRTRIARTLLLALTASLAGVAVGLGESAGGAGDGLLVAVQQPAAPAQATPEGFEPVSGAPAPQEQLPAAPLLIAAYAFVWLMLVGYLWSIWRRLAAVERELTGVARRVDEMQRR
jgi:CcmD family protein